MFASVNWQKIDMAVIANLLQCRRRKDIVSSPPPQKYVARQGARNKHASAKLDYSDDQRSTGISGSDPIALDTGTDWSDLDSTTPLKDGRTKIAFDKNKAETELDYASQKSFLVDKIKYMKTQNSNINNQWHAFLEAMATGHPAQLSTQSNFYKSSHWKLTSPWTRPRTALGYAQGHYQHPV